jgi:hypothetical protein
VALSRECRFLDEAQHHLLARWHGVEDTFGFNRRMQVCHLLWMLNANSFQECVKRRAVKSVMTHESKPTQEVAERLVDQVFPSCFRDTRY